MEVKPGYKQTEVGVIPEEWEVKPLASIADNDRGMVIDSVQRRTPTVEGRANVQEPEY